MRRSGYVRSVPRTDDTTPSGPPPATTLFCRALPRASTGETASLSPEEIAHARALRLSAGETVLLTDGRSSRWEAELTEVDRRTITCRLVAPRPAPDPRPLTLWAPVGNRDRSLWLVEKAVELGVRSIVFAECARSRSVADAGRSSGFLDRARRRAIAALTQSGGAHLPDLDGPRELETLLRTAPDAGGARLLADPGGRPLLEAVGERSFESAVWLVGPEGGLTDWERHAASAAGFDLVGLGARTLRFETATVAGLAILAAVLDARAGRVAGGRTAEAGDASRGATRTKSLGASEPGPDRSRGGAA